MFKMTENPHKLFVRKFESDPYLERIRFPRRVRVTDEGLEALHRAQVSTIPFENFDILLGRGVSLDPLDVFRKLVLRSRGGYCFELNGLFLMALQSFGFEARPLLARVHRSGTPMGRGHQISLVTVRGRHWIADVGFGSPHLPAPLPLEIGHTATLDGRDFRLAGAGPFGVMLQTLNKGLWQDLYSFDDGYVCPGDIAYGHHFTSTHPGSLFTSARVAALPSPDGRVSLFNRTLRIITGEAEAVAELAEGPSYLGALKDHFGIDLDAPYEALPPIQVAKPGQASPIGF
jgi:N-hydroxyarylamine O-acetyltransferase